MAKKPSKKFIEKIQKQSQVAIDDKRIDQQLLDKDFVVNGDGHGPGVIPEEIWQQHKNVKGLPKKRGRTAINDGSRVYPVDILVLHHSTGPRFDDTDELTIQDWFSDTGKARAYENGAINPMHEHPGRPGQLTYAQAQYAGSPDSSNKYDYRLTDLIADPFQNVAWHAGNWDINTRSIGIENCGDYRNYALTDQQAMCIADWARDWDKEIGGTLTIMLHGEIYATECPARIRESRDKIVDMINNPDKWNKTLWPEPAPQPTPTPVPTPTPTPTPTWTYKVVDENGKQLGVYSVKLNAWKKFDGNGRKGKIVDNQSKDLTADFIKEFAPSPTPVPVPDPNEDDQNGRISALEAFMKLVKDLFAKIGIKL